MKNHRTSPTCLAIIGNGFDLAHGYKTSYHEFTESIGEDFFSKYKAHLAAFNSGSDTEWHNFEAQIEKLTGEFYQREMSEPEPTGSAEEKIKDFNIEFQKVAYKLLEYLDCEIMSKPLLKKKSIQNEIDDNVIGLNFNYTDTAEHYLDSVLYVHGSIKEREIVLGYDPVDSYCLASYENRYWFKQLCRERLAFIRQLKDDPLINSDETLYRELFEDFECLMGISHPGKGFEQEDLSRLLHSDYFRNYTPSLYSGNILMESNISLNKISKILILGHSIMSDKEYLDGIFSQCLHLQEVLIFSYNGENPREFRDKEAFIKTYCKQIEKKMY